LRMRPADENVRRLSDKISPIRCRDNDWLRLTGDDQRKFRVSDGALQCVDSCWWL
jgi:hypothetical protein